MDGDYLDDPNGEYRGSDRYAERQASMVAWVTGEILVGRDPEKSYERFLRKGRKQYRRNKVRRLLGMKEKRDETVYVVADVHHGEELGRRK